MEFIQKIFGTENKLPTGGKTLNDFLEYNNQLINRVVQEIIDPFLKPGTENETDLSYTLKLLDADTCGQMAFFLSKQMADTIKTFDISGFGAPINMVVPGGHIITEANIQTPNGLVSRKQICDRLAAHYITILNLIGAILTAINPDTNMALARMNSLYTLVDGTADKYLINICQPEGKRVVQNNILDEPGLRGFLGLYLFHLLSVSESPADKDRVMQEYQNLVRKLVDEDRTVAMPLEIPTSENTNNNSTQNITITNTASNQPHPQIPQIINNTTKPDIPSTTTNTNPANPANPANPGIFKILTDKLASGLDSILPTQPGQQQQPNNKTQINNTTNNLNSSPSTLSTNQNYSFSESEREQKQAKINKLENEINNKRLAGKSINDPEIKDLTLKIQKLIGELDSETSESSSNNSSYRKWLSYKKRKYGNSSSSNNNTTTQYGGTITNSNTNKKNELSADASITRFINFMEKYIHENPNDKRTIMRNVLTLFKGGHFKKPDTTRIKTLCRNAHSEGKPIILQIDPNNLYLKAFNANYLEMRHNYIKSVGELVDILENHILILNPKNNKKEIRNLTSRQLSDLESRTRAILAQLYSSSHMYYISGVNSLYDYYHNLTSGVEAF